MSSNSQHNVVDLRHTVYQMRDWISPSQKRRRLRRTSPWGFQHRHFVNYVCERRELQSTRRPSAWLHVTAIVLESLLERLVVKPEGLDDVSSICIGVWL